jgi:YidC/Oxa1 family membrane protein insertase
MLGIFNAPIGVAYHMLFALAGLLAPLPGGLATAAAIVIFTVAVRLLLSPLSFTALRGQAGLAALQPQVAQLRARYAHQPDRLQRELAGLYQAQGGTLLAGCLPLLVQLPFFSVLYRLFRSATVGGRANALLARDLLGTPLGSHLFAGPGLLSAHGLVFLGLFGLLAVACFAIARLARATSQAAGAAPGGNASGAGLARQLGRIVPYLTVIIAAVVPLAAVLYLLTTTTWTAAERAVWRWWSGRPGHALPTEAAG